MIEPIPLEHKYIAGVDPYGERVDETQLFIGHRITDLEGNVRFEYKRLWDACKPTLSFSKSPVQIYRNGDRWSVAMYGERLWKPVMFGTGGNQHIESCDFEAMFYSPETYKMFPNIWEDDIKRSTFIKADGTRE
jgi:hypothetical protein